MNWLHRLRTLRAPFRATSPHGPLALGILLGASLALVAYHQSVVVTALLDVGLVPQAVIGVLLVHALRISWGSVPTARLSRAGRVIAWCGAGVTWVLVAGWWLALPAGAVVATMHHTPDWWWGLPFVLHIACSLVHIQHAD